MMKKQKQAQLVLFLVIMAIFTYYTSPMTRQASPEIVFNWKGYQFSCSVDCAVANNQVEVSPGSQTCSKSYNGAPSWSTKSSITNNEDEVIFAIQNEGSSRVASGARCTISNLDLTNVREIKWPITGELAYSGKLGGSFAYPFGLTIGGGSHDAGSFSALIYDVTIKKVAEGRYSVSDGIRPVQVVDAPTSIGISGASEAGSTSASLRISTLPTVICDIGYLFNQTSLKCEKTTGEIIPQTLEDSYLIEQKKLVEQQQAYLLTLQQNSTVLQQQIEEKNTQLETALAAATTTAEQTTILQNEIDALKIQISQVPDPNIVKTAEPSLNVITTTQSTNAASLKAESYNIWFYVFGSAAAIAIGIIIYTGRKKR